MATTNINMATTLERAATQLETEGYTSLGVLAGEDPATIWGCLLDNTQRYTVIERYMLLETVYDECYHDYGYGIASLNVATRDKRKVTRFLRRVARRIQTGKLNPTT